MKYQLSEIHKAVELIKPLLSKYKVVLFNGPMGAGKTTLISALCRELKSEDDISSPTFSIVNEYQSAFGKIYHFDFYRIESLEEAFDFGVEEYLFSENYCFIEWSERVLELLPESLLIVEIDIIDENTRQIQLIEK